MFYGFIHCLYLLTEGERLKGDLYPEVKRQVGRN
jgi:hypothetical protein